MSYKNYYFLGIGGIGMSAIARYFKAKGFAVAGYDRTRSELCQTLEKEGIDIHYIDNENLIPKKYRNPETTLVVYTPAIPSDNREIVFFRENNFQMQKRAQILGHITQNSRGLCIAGTHGKTTTSNLTAHILNSSSIGCNAFLGGIAKNFDTNLVLSEKNDLVVIEADEFDRSFHQLRPYMAVITASDADHLDIYGTKEELVESFNYFTSLIQPEGCLIVKKGIAITPRLQKNVGLYTYSATEGGDFYAENILIENGEIHFDFVSEILTIRNINLGVPMWINIENAVAAIALAVLNGVSANEIRSAVSSFLGTKRRFEFHLKSEKINFLDDYAHHPEELKASIISVKTLFPQKKICIIFQPHLYTRTRDFATDFAKSLSLVDDVILLDIYPARELPIEGVTSEIILHKMTSKQKTICAKNNLIEELKKHDFDVLLTVGAGDIDLMIPQIKKELEKRL